MQLFPNPDDNFSRRSLLTGSSNISSDPPIIPVLVFFFFFFFPLHWSRGYYRSHHMGCYKTTRYVFQELPNSSVAEISARSWWARRGPVQESRTRPWQQLLRESTPPCYPWKQNTHTSLLKCSGLSMCPPPGCGVWDSGGAAGGFYIIYILLELMCVSQSERDRLRDGGCVVKKGNFCLNSSRT